MSSKARTTGLILGPIGASLLLACVIIGSAAAAELKIGFTLSLSGGTDDYGKGARMGAQLALKEYYDKGGYKGQKVEAVIYDDETKPAKGVENVTRLITRDKVFAIVGPVNSGVDQVSDECGEDRESEGLSGSLSSSGWPRLSASNSGFE